MDVIYDKKFPWSDNWWIEDGRAWFCAGEISAIFCVDLNSGRCDLVAWIPECDIMDFRLYTSCIKENNFIFCIPNMAKYVWYYDVKKMDWGRIEVGNEKQLLMSMPAYDKRNNRIWLFEDAKGGVFEVSLEKKTREKKYQLPDNETMSFYESILVEDEIYCVSGYKVYCINSEGIHAYEISDAKTELCTICYDGRNFWLSGHCKDIYVWNPNRGIVKVLEEFPQQFGFYHFERGKDPVVDCSSLFCGDFPFYINSILLGKYIWYIPFRSNEIVYIDIDTYEIHLLEVEEEKETKESIANHILAHKYLLQYVYADRFIGIYSLKNGWIFEVDTVDLCVRKKNYRLSGGAILAIARADKSYYGQRLFRERRKESILFSALLDTNGEEQGEEFSNIGGFIYRTLD